MIHNAGNLMRRGHLGLGRADPRLETAIEGAQCRLAASDRSRRLQESLAGSIVALAGGRSDDFATGDAVVGTEFEPGGEMLFGRELAHIRADLADDLLPQVLAEAIHRQQVNAGEAAQMLADAHGRAWR